MRTYLFLFDLPHGSYDDDVKIPQFFFFFCFSKVKYLSLTQKLSHVSFISFFSHQSPEYGTNTHMIYTVSGHFTLQYVGSQQVIV